MKEISTTESNVDGFFVLVCWQVDDFAVASKSMAIAKKVIAIINKHVMMKFIRSEEDNQGLHFFYNSPELTSTKPETITSCHAKLTSIIYYKHMAGVHLF